MRWSDWKPIYESIVDEFGYDRGRELASMKAGAAASEHSAKVLKGSGAMDALRNRISDGCVVTGGAGTLEMEMLALGKIMFWRDAAVVASDGSCETLDKMGLVPDVIVTDLDGNIEVERRMNRDGALIVVHFHGDNYERASSFISSLEGNAIVTTQAGQTKHTFNFGGFTDGDRAVLLCEEFGARKIMLAGFDYSRTIETGGNSKLKLSKLGFAKRIIEDASRRGVDISYPSRESNESHAGL